MSARRNPETTRKPMDTEQLRKRLRARLERCEQAAETALARGRWHVHSCRFCAHGRQVGVAFLLCPVGVKRYTKAWVAAGRRLEAALVLREVSRGR